MGSDMVVALSTATADGVALFGQNCTLPASWSVALVRAAGRNHEAGESVSLSHLRLPQARQTYEVLGLQAAGAWGFLGGVNEHHVSAGQTAIRTRLPALQPAITGCELVRVALERSSSACQAVDCITDLVTRHGQGDQGFDHTFLVADAKEAFVVETAGAHWAVQEIGAVRAVSAVCLLRQDWNRLSRGLADVAISREWWPGDGSKLDFAGVVAPDHGNQPAALRRWGQATLMLEQQNGHIDGDFVRRILSDYNDSLDDADALQAFVMERSLCRFPLDADSPATAASWCVETNESPSPVLAWCAFGPPALSVYFPIFLDAELPAAFQADTPQSGCLLWRRLLQLAAKRGDGVDLAAVREGLAGLQARFDFQAKEMLTEAATMKQRGDSQGAKRLLGSFMQANVECFEGFWTSLVEPRAEPASPAQAALAGMMASSD